VEISPHPILVPAIREGRALAGADDAAAGCLHRDEPERAAMLDTAGLLHRAGCQIDWDRVFGEPAPRYVRLPSYPWRRRRYWLTQVTDRADSAPAFSPGRPTPPAAGPRA